ncbi:TenA family protein [Tistrella mobilis]|uniref:Aminopyrimidine aminohydrolase n=1 Tax=Tistrella mobilis (strain KA081020-065) TaxID=1110502 RepID=I3TIT5_TISMK|nr:TenA family protein [Tistrella mobilis]AFK52673.1 transcriptional activator, TenA family [Tistrella mobilis KA081020-065]MAM73479.1 TenA family transcriptional regulator [Tistrella sp.]
MSASPAEARFSLSLRAAAEPDWSAVTGHRFTDELIAGTLDDAVLARYLVQDHRFIDAFVALLGAAIASADRFEARIPLCRFAAMVTSDENDYFLRAFKALGVDEAMRADLPDHPATATFKALMAEARLTADYACCLAVLVVAEWSYLSWAERAGGRLPPRFEHAEWITLHDNPFFREFVGWLVSELDRVGAMLDDAARARVEDLFRRAVAAERAFFDAAYAAA